MSVERKSLKSGDICRMDRSFLVDRVVEFSQFAFPKRRCKQNKMAEADF